MAAPVASGFRRLNRRRKTVPVAGNTVTLEQTYEELA